MGYPFHFISSSAEFAKIFLFFRLEPRLGDYPALRRVPRQAASRSNLIFSGKG